jgi:transketolase
MTMTSEPSVQVDVDQLSVDTIRTLAMDAVQQANSGHPGTPMALAPVAYCLWQRFLRFDPEDPIWPNRDRFVLSNGHASMLLYSLLHLSGVRAVNPAYERLGEPSVTLDDIKRFRQLDSKCPGHPEYRWTSGVETTTGPLGQGVATTVGMALASNWMAQYFNRPGFEMFGYDVYAFLWRWRLDGGHFERGSFAGGSLEAGKPMLDLRQQQDHDRGKHGLGVQRGRSRALHRIWVERHSRRGRQRLGLVVTCIDAAHQ